MIIAPLVKSGHQRTDSIVDVRPSWNRGFQKFPDLRLVLRDELGRRGDGETSMT
jgi:hypothetical protein